MFAYLVDIGIYGLTTDGLAHLKKQDDSDLKFWQRRAFLFGSRGSFVQKRGSFVVVVGSIHRQDQEKEDKSADTGELLKGNCAEEESITVGYLYRKYIHTLDRRSGVWERSHDA